MKMQQTFTNLIYSYPCFCMSDLSVSANLARIPNIKNNKTKLKYNISFHEAAYSLVLNAINSYKSTEEISYYYANNY